jgi:hypothetical protein
MSRTEATIFVAISSILFIVCARMLGPLTFALAPLALAIDFGPAGHVFVGAAPNAIVALDVNDDARLDLVTANASQSGVSLLRGKGDGSFLARIDFPSAGAARGLTIADVNADGFDDVAVVNVAGGTVSLLLGNGTTLVPGGRFRAGAAPQAVAADDVDADGYVDLVTASTSGPSVTVLLGQGDGTFAAPVGYATRTGSYSVVITDVDNDGVSDIVSTDSLANTLSFLIGNGDGTFQPARQSSPVGARPRWVSLGAAGLYVASLGGAGGVGSGVYLVALDGGPSTRYAVGSAPGWVAIDDFDQDGYEDLVATRSGANRVVVRGGQDAALSTLVVGKSPSGAAIADFNEDSIPDLAVANRGSNRVTVFLNDGQEAPPGATCVVPRLARATLPVARVAVRAGGCTVGRVTRKYSRVRKGRVIAQRPKAGTRLPAGASVALVLSRGPRR